MRKVIIFTIIAAIIIFASLFTVHFMLKGETKPTHPVSVEAANAAGVSITPERGLRFRINQENHPISVFLLAMVMVMQLFAMLLAGHVISTIKSSDSSSDLKLKRLENADIFLDLPLYIGLFGTVVSFIIITFSPQMGRLIAYSSTIIGIIISVILRTTMLFPYRQQLITKRDEESRKIGDVKA